jgi:phage tail-like protein
MPRNDPLRNFRFSLEIGGIQQANFSEVTMAETTTDAIDYREGNEKAAHVRKLDGLTKYGNVTLKWGVTDSRELHDWHNAVLKGQIQSNRKQVAIIVMDESGTAKARFVISEAWPMKYQPSGLNGKGNEVFIELIELANEGIERVQ